MGHNPRASFTTRLHRSRLFWLGLIVLLLGVYWLLPIRGQVVIITHPQQVASGIWPQIWTEPAHPEPGTQATLYLRDTQPWAYIKLLIDGVEATRDESYLPGAGPWSWRWRFTAPEQPGYTAVFYHDCHTGCIERSRATLGRPKTTPPPAARVPTKLGVVFADFSRNWHERAGWSIEMTYVNRQDDADFSIDGLAYRVHQATQRGLRVLVRVAYDRRQAIPPANDELALARYLEYCSRLARDERLRDVYAYIIGNGLNSQQENALAPDNPNTPEWYARVFSGYTLSADRTDNVLQTMRLINPQVRVLVGSISPWNSDQNGNIRDPLDQPWLNYFTTLVAYLNQTAQLKASAGYPFVAPDGFAVQAPGRPASPYLGVDPSQEAQSDLYHPEWGTAQAGFRVYRDWLAIVNRYPSTQGLPLYITATNTFTTDPGIPPAQNYPRGWLTAALNEINQQPQVRALCWFVDAPLGDMWKEFSLQRHMGRMNDAATEFDQLLQSPARMP